MTRDSKKNLFGKRKGFITFKTDDDTFEKYLRNMREVYLHIHAAADLSCEHIRELLLSHPDQYSNYYYTCLGGYPVEEEEEFEDLIHELIGDLDAIELTFLMTNYIPAASIRETLILVLDDHKRQFLYLKQVSCNGRIASLNIFENEFGLN
jgi:hypothetical protein